MAFSEFEFVAWLSGRQGNNPPVTLGIGDDMAMIDLGQPSIECGAGRMLISSDLMLDGVHFDSSKHTPRQIGRKAIACSLSDCAAMAVKPLAATVSVALPTETTLDDAKELFEGMFAIADEFDLAIVGGDTTRWSGSAPTRTGLAIDVSITALPYEGVEPVTRSGAKPGDQLLVTGKLGGSLLGRHLDFVPRVREARALAQQIGPRLHAMIDLSDGLALDLWRLCRASNVGATLDERLLESIISDAARQIASADESELGFGVIHGGPLDHALSDGEDFELLLAVAEENGECRIANSEKGTPCPNPQSSTFNLQSSIFNLQSSILYPIGSVTSGDLLLLACDGEVRPLEPRGYVH